MKEFISIAATIIVIWWFVLVLYGVLGYFAGTTKSAGTKWIRRLFWQANKKMLRRNRALSWKETGYYNHQFDLENSTIRNIYLKYGYAKAYLYCIKISDRVQKFVKKFEEETSELYEKVGNDYDIDALMDFEAKEKL